MWKEVLGVLAGWGVFFLVCKAGDSREVELGTKLRGGIVVPLEDEAPAMVMLESRMGKAASQWVWAAMMNRSRWSKKE